MDNKKIIDIINMVKSAGGATLAADSLKSAEIKSGYMVSLDKHELKVAADDPGLIEAVKKAIIKNQTWINSKKGASKYFIGLWLDGGFYYIDISKNIGRLDRALEFAKNNEQLSIYDANDGSYISVSKDIYILYSYDWKYDDFFNVWEFESLNDIKNYLKLDKNADIYRSVINSINRADVAGAKILLDKYIIVKDRAAIIDEL